MDRFIMDMGKAVMIKNLATGESIEIPRYGVWINETVVDVGNDLKALKEQYSIVGVIDKTLLSNRFN